MRFFNLRQVCYLIDFIYSKGKGLRLSGSTNVIIQNVRFSDINAQYVWGGDAIGLEGASKIWVSLH
jgi:pectate lyase